MREVGNRIYTINEKGKPYVRVWKILEINGNQYRCENKRTDAIHILSENEVKIYDNREEAEKIVEGMRRKKALPALIIWLILALIFFLIFGLPFINALLSGL